MPRLARAELLGQAPGEPSDAVRTRVQEARERQRLRYRGTPIRCNAQLPGPRARREARLAPEAEALLASAVESLALTGRGFDRALKVARTVADLEASDVVSGAHLAESLSYRLDLDDEAAARAG